MALFAGVFLDLRGPRGLFWPHISEPGLLEWCNPAISRMRTLGASLTWLG